MKRVVVDPTSCSQRSSAIRRSAPAILLEAIHDHAVEMVACPTLIAEVRDNLTEPYFRVLLGQDEAEQAVSAIERVAMMLDDLVAPEQVLRDSGDDYLLALALARSAKAEAIITGDKDLLDHPGLQPPAISARKATDRLAAPPPE